MNSVVFDIGKSAVTFSSSRELKSGIFVGFAPNSEAWMTCSHRAFQSADEIRWLAERLVELADHEDALRSHAP